MLRDFCCSRSVHRPFRDEVHGRTVSLPLCLLEQTLPGSVSDWTELPLMFVLCPACVETTNCGVCGHTRNERWITGTWVSVELQNAVTFGYVIVEIYKAWNYDERTVYDQATAIEVVSHIT